MSEPTREGVAASTPQLPDARDLSYARMQVEDWLDRYVRMSRAWNAPDDEYTRNAAIGFARSIIEEALS